MMKGMGKQGQRARGFLPLERRLLLYDKVLRLQKQGLSYNEIIDRIHFPLGNVNKLNVKLYTFLAHIIGVKFSDGYIYKHGRDYVFELRTVDFEYARTTGTILGKLLGRNRPYKPHWHGSAYCWYVKCGSVLPYQVLQQPLETLKPYIEHCGDCIVTFLRAFFDGEGSISRRMLTATNTDFGLLLYIQQLLWQYFDIETTGPRGAVKAGYSFRDSQTGKTYHVKKECYRLYVRTKSLSRFYRCIGFGIRRKQQGLTYALNEHSYPSPFSFSRIF